MELSTEERHLVEVLFMQGPAALLDRMTQSELKKFCARKEVQSALMTLVTDYNQQADAKDRSRFLLRRSMAKLGPRAIEVLSECLDGVLYLRGPQNEVLRDDKNRPMIARLGPDEMQLAAARDVLDRLGVEFKDKEQQPAEVTLNVILQRVEQSEVQLVYAPNLTEPQKTLSRERVRSAIETLMPKVKNGHDKLIDTLSPKSKKKKKVVAKVLPAPGGSK